MVGPKVQIGNGTARSFVITTPNGKPQELGIELSAGALQGLPDGEFGADYMIDLPQKAQQLTPFNHIMINWNPYGHPPPGIYTVPHFDFHFYEISVETQMAIPPYTDQTAAMFDNFPPLCYIPEAYVPNPEGVPQMGKHWSDVLSPEFNGGTFTKTFVYGSFDGAVTFYEPMITKAYLESVHYSATDIRQPQFYYPLNKYYPTKYRVYHDTITGSYFVSLNGFEWKQ